MESCNACKGSGTVPCPACGGTGLNPNHQNEVEPNEPGPGNDDKKCHKCSGTGEIICTHCGGTGHTV